MDRKKIVIIIGLILILILTIIFIVFFLTGKLFLEFGFKELEFSLNNQGYKSSSPFIKKLSPGDYELKITKEYYLDYQQKITIKRGQTTKLKVNLELKPEVKQAIIKTIEKYLKTNSASGIKYSIDNLKIENKKASAVIGAPDISGSTIYLEEINGKWTVTFFGSDTKDYNNEDISSEEKIKNDWQGKVWENDFSIEYFAKTDEFYIDVGEKSCQKCIDNALKWFKNRNVDPDKLKIIWVYSNKSLPSAPYVAPQSGEPDE